jgi:hypothetical protein
MRTCYAPALTTTAAEHAAKDTDTMAEKIYIVSGEGDYGTRELYTGTRTARALRLRLTRERCEGDRWAKIVDADGCELDPDITFATD